jgi:hypothetical protein
MRGKPIYLTHKTCGSDLIEKKLKKSTNQSFFKKIVLNDEIEKENKPKKDVNLG